MEFFSYTLSVRFRLGDDDTKGSTSVVLLYTLVSSYRRYPYPFPLMLYTRFLDTGVVGF